ncbi:nucleoside triphosphate pyrophosphatase [Oerskovia sp. KBS0722]|uniref:Maf family protein n=1 Tax=Oerskovia sp. KBS0722 TaxID=1179673 RepID=UPI00110E1DF7|nr:nucleoside triphosphate pyrophosphatase [Oerskovia sp. KBS0722]QDW63883.1 septum formation inhibitor Maf [Oerskovia sp. KBS0722]
MTAATSAPGVRLLLASQSPARLATLRSAGVSPEVRVSGLDEDAVLEAAAARFGALDPADAVLVLAQAKAEEVAQVLSREARERDDVSDVVGPEEIAPVVVGCDSMLEFAGAVHGKPRDAAEATERWRAMRGRTGVLHTGHWIVDLRDPQDGGSGATLGATSSTTIHFADVSDAEIAAYVATGEPLAVAGAFTVDGLGGAFVESIEGDHHGVVGISLPLVRELLGEIGVTWTDLWS